MSISRGDRIALLALLVAVLALVAAWLAVPPAWLAVPEFRKLIGWEQQNPPPSAPKLSKEEPTEKNNSMGNRDIKNGHSKQKEYGPRESQPDTRFDRHNNKSVRLPYFATPKDNGLIRIDSVDWGENDDHGYIEIKYVALSDIVYPKSSTIELTCYDNKARVCGKETMKLPLSEKLLKGTLRSQLIRLRTKPFSAKMKFINPQSE